MALLTPVRVIYYTERPSVLTKASNLLQAAPALVSSGFALVSDEILKLRRDTCVNRCPGQYWDASGNAGFGECTHPRCGCSKFKLNFKAMSCPAGLWRAIA